MHASHERRRQNPSYTMPFVFEALEMVLIWIVFGIAEGSLDVMQWSLISYGLSLVWFVYTFIKLGKVLNRQNAYKW